MKKNPSRRIFIRDVGLASLSIPLSSLTCEEPQQKKSTMHSNKNKLGIALVGLGNYSTGQLAPALQQTEHCYLAGIVTGTPSKADTWKEKYKIPSSEFKNKLVIFTSSSIRLTLYRERSYSGRTQVLPGKLAAHG